jgi:hypothetical protein
VRRTVTNFSGSDQDPSFPRTDKRCSCLEAPLFGQHVKAARQHAGSNDMREGMCCSTAMPRAVSFVVSSAPVHALHT